METAVFLISAAIVLAGAVGVVVSRNPVHAALSLVATLFGVAVLFVAQSAPLLAAVQIIVYTGAIVVLILFVLMLLGVDRTEDLRSDPIVAQRPLAILVGVGLVAMLGVALFLPVVNGDEGATVDNTVVTGERSATAPITDAPQPGDGGPPVAEGSGDSNFVQVGRVLFTDYVFAFEVTAALLTIAVVGAVVFARRPDHYERLPEPERMLEPGPLRGAGEAPEGTAGEAGEAES